MINILLLCKIQFKEMFATSLTNRFKKIGFGFAVGLLGIFFLSLSIFYTIMIGNTLKEVGQLDYLPTLFFVITSFITFFTTLFQVKGTIIGSSDYESLLCIPVKQYQIVLSKMIMLYLYEFVFTIIFMLPADIYFFIYSNMAMSIVASVFALFFIPILPIGLAVLLNFLFCFISERLPFKNIIQVLFICFIVTIIFILSINLGNSTSQSAAELIITIIAKTKKLFPLMDFYLKACVQSSVGYFFLFMGVNLLVLIGVSLIVGFFYKKMNYYIYLSRQNPLTSKKRIVFGSEFRAYLYKEAQTYFFTPTYFLQTIVGGFLVIAFASFFCYEYSKGNLTVHIFEGTYHLNEMLTPYLSVLICFFVGLTPLTSRSISMEGSQIWMIKTAPIHYLKYFGAKVTLNQIMMGGCAFIASLVFVCVLPLSAWDIVCILLLPQCYIFFHGALGLYINLRYPKIQRNSEQVVIKSFTAFFISLAIGIAVLIIFILLTIFFYSLSIPLYGAICFALFLGNGLSIFFTLCKGAEKAFLQINDF